MLAIDKWSGWWTLNYEPFLFLGAWSCCRTGTISYLPYHISSYVSTPIQAPLSLFRQAILWTQIDLLQMSPQTLLWPLCMSEFLWMWLPAQTVAHWKGLDCKQPWEPSNCTWEVCMTMYSKIMHTAIILTHGWLFNFPENEILKLTVELVSGRDNIQTCLSISAPTHLLPMNVYVFFSFFNLYHQ